tara:strand:- start:8524 stop:10779 length:2256 start_codon:yes stop_codon:yes gene_type:complete
MHSNSPPTFGCQQLVARDQVQSPLGPSTPYAHPSPQGEEEFAIRNIISVEDIITYLQRFWKLSAIIAGTISLLLLILLTGRTPLYSSSTHLEVAIAEEGTWSPSQVLENSAVFLVNNHKLSLQTRAFHEYFYQHIDAQDRVDFLEDRGFKKPLVAKGIALAKDCVSSTKEMVSNLFQDGDDSGGDGWEQDLFIKKLTESTIKIVEEKESHIIRVEAKGPNASLVASMANQYASLYSEYLALVNRKKARARFDFLKETEENYRAQAIASLRELNKFRIENDVMEQNSGLGIVNDEVKRLNEERARIRVAYTTAESVLLQVDKAKLSGASLLSISEIATSPSVAERYKTLVQKQQEYSSNLSLFGPEHLKVKQIQHELDSLAQAIDAEVGQTVQRFINTKESSQERLASLDGELQKVLDQVLDNDRKSLELANLLARAESDQKTYNEILAKLNQVKVEMEVPESSKVRVIDTAVPAEKPYRPNKLLSAIISGFLFASMFVGLPLCLGLTEDLSRKFGLRIPYIHKNLPEEISEIPVIHANSSMNMLAEAFGPGAARESFFKLAAQVDREWQDSSIKTLLVTSALEGEGKSFLAATLGGVFTAQGKKTLIIDCNLRAPAMSYWFPHLQGRANLVSWLESGGDEHFDLESLRHGDSNLFVLPSQGWASTPEKQFSKKCFQDLLSFANRDFDVVILDGPPVTGYEDVSILGPYATKMLMVSDSKLSDYRTLARSLDKLGEVNREKLIGLVANRQDS